MTLMHLKPAKVLDERFETLKYRVLGLLNGHTPSENIVLAFTSCSSKEGVSSVAANFAVSLANEGGRSVLLMDGNLRKPYLYSLVHKRSEEGNQNKKESFGNVWQVVTTNINLDMLVTHGVVQKPGHVFHKTWFMDLLRQAKERYDCIVIDCPPIASDGSAAFLASRASAVILVVEAERLRREVIQRAVAQLEDAGANILGAVLNKRKYPIPQFIYNLL